MKHISILFTVLSICALFSCHHGDNEGPSAKSIHHAVLFYMISENSLLSADSSDIRELLKAKDQLKDNEEIIIYLDNNTFPAIYQITNKTEATMLSEMEPVYRYAEEHNSACQQSLEDFLTYVNKYYPADNYSIVFWSHGTGWVPSSYSGDTKNFSRRRAFGIDNGQNTNKNTGNQMSISELHKALQGFGRKFNYVMFDCCFMQCAEIDYELRDVTDYIIASPAEIPYDGAPYADLMRPLFDEETFTKTIPDTYYQAYKKSSLYGALMSTVNCAKMEDLMQATKKVVAAHSNELKSMSFSGVLDYFIYDKWKSVGHFPDYYDMNGMMRKLLADAEYKEWKATFDSAVPFAIATDAWYSIYAYTVTGVGIVDNDQSQYCGVSMYVPLDKYSTDEYSKENAYFVEGFPQSQWAKAVWQ